MAGSAVTELFRSAGRWIMPDRWREVSRTALSYCKQLPAMTRMTRASANVPVPDLRAELKNGIKGLRVGVPRAHWFNENKGTDSETEAIFNDALKVLEGLGAIVFEIDGQPFSLARKANQTILTAEAYAYHEKRFQEAPEKFGSSVRRRMVEGAFLSAADYITALRARTVLNEKSAQTSLGRYLRHADCASSTGGF